MGDISQDTTVVVDGLTLLPTQDRQKPYIAALLSAFLAEVQTVENAVFATAASVQLASAAGVQLDQWGKILKQTRNGLADALYLLRLQAKLLIDLRSGEIETINSIMRLICPQGATIAVQEFQPATFMTNVLGVPLPNFQEVWNNLQLAKASGIQAILHWETVDDAHSFSFLEDPTGLGFDDGTGTVGGVFTSVM